MIDIGEVPHGFGVVPDGTGGQPAAFWSSLGATLNDFEYWFKDFTAYNIGNTNLLNLRMAAARPGLVSDTVQDPSSAPGFVIPGTSQAVQPGQRDNTGACVVSSLDPLFWDDANPFWPNRPRTFHKARVGETEPMLTVPDLPERLHRTVNFNQQDYLPKVSVAVPLGQPTGRYYGALTFFEDGVDAQPDGVYGETESVGDPILNIGVRVQEARLTDGFLPGSAPHLDSSPVALGPGNASVITGDVSPVAYRDLNTGNMHMIWASSRYGRDILGNPEPQATDPWYIHISSLPRLDLPAQNPLLEWQFFSAVDPRWWLPTDWSAAGGPGAPFPPPNDVDSLFPWAVNPSTVRFNSPSVAMDRGVSPVATWLFLAGQAEPAVGPVAGSREKPIASKAFYVQLDDGSPVDKVVTSTHDWTMPKFGIRGGVSRSPEPMLWSFWYGGSSDRWRIYYTANAQPSNPEAWRNEAQLPVPRGLTSVAEPSPVFRWWQGETGPTFDVVYSGYSVFHRNTDIYLSRYAPDQSAAVPLRGGHWPLRLLALPSRATGARVGCCDIVPGEALARDAATSVWHSRDVDWADGYEVFAYPDPDDPSVRHKLNVGRPERDNATGALAYDYSGNATLRQLYRAVVINPSAGTVKLLKAPDPRTVIVALYSPRAYRVSLSGSGVDVASDVSPCALMDDGPNPRFNPSSLGNPFFVPSSGSVAPPTDRFWTFWRRPGLDKPGTGIHYKAFRYAVQLGPQIGVETGTGKPLIDDVQINGAEPKFPVEVDWMKNRLYFAADDAWTLSGGQVVPGRVRVSYVSDDGNDIQDEMTIAFLEDQVGREGTGSTTFGTLTSVMVNEGQVQAFKDPLSNKVWVFWTSTRDGSTDVFYSAISPKFYGEQL